MLHQLIGKDLLLEIHQNKRQEVGHLVHKFSHVHHHMAIEHIILDSRTETTQKNVEWMNEAKLHQIGITTGMKKVLRLVTKKGVKRTLE